MFVLTTLFCAQAVLGVKFTSTKSGEANDWDGPLDFSAGKDKVLTGVESSHDNGREDRKWKFYTTEADGLTCSAGSWTAGFNRGANDKWANDWDGPLDFKCPTNSALTAVNSNHDNGKEDRRWRFKCCDITSGGKFSIQSVHTTGWLNRFDEKLDAKCNPNSVLVGLKSFHANHQEDRRWALKCGVVQEKAKPIVVLPSPEKTDFLNDWDKPLAWTAPADLIIKNRHGICLDTPRDFDMNGGKIHMQSCSSTNENQHWVYTASNGQLRNWVSRGGCLQVGETDPSTVVLDFCNFNNVDQQWDYNASTGLLRLRKSGQASGVCLESPERNQNGGKVVLRSCNKDNKDQLWDIGTGGVKAIVGLASEHDNNREDRRWKAYYSSTPGVRCADGGGNSNAPSDWTVEQNDLDKELDFTCPKNMIMAGIAGDHQNRQEDRRFQFRCCDVESSGFHISSVRTIGEVNEFDEKMDFTCAKNEVLVGLEAHHSNRRQDRIFTPKCGVLTMNVEEPKPKVGATELAALATALTSFGGKCDQFSFACMGDLVCMMFVMMPPDSLDGCVANANCNALMACVLGSDAAPMIGNQFVYSSRGSVPECDACRLSFPKSLNAGDMVCYKNSNCYGLGAKKSKRAFADHNAAGGCGFLSGVTGVLCRIPEGRRLEAAAIAPPKAMEFDGDMLD